MSVCLSIDFTNKVESSEADVCQGEFALFLSKIGEFSDTETPGRQFGLSDVYDAAKTNWANLGKGPPGPRGEITLEPIIPVIGGSFALGERGKGKTGRERSANVTNEERTTEESEYGPEGNEIENEFS